MSGRGRFSAVQPTASLSHRSSTSTVTSLLYNRRIVIRRYDEILTQEYQEYQDYMEQYQQRLTYLPTYLLTYLLTWQDYKRGMLSSSGPGHASAVSLTSMLVYGSIVKYASFILVQHTTVTIAAVCLLLDFLDFFRYVSRRVLLGRLLLLLHPFKDPFSGDYPGEPVPEV